MIIGCGAQGCGVGQEKNPDKIINFAHALSEHKGFNMIDFCDKDDLRGLNIALYWKGYYVCYSTLQNLQDGYDIAIVATPDETHYEILKQLSKYPLKLVICEKPICQDLQQAREIVELYKAMGISLLVNYTRRFLPYYDYLKQYGKPLYAFCRFNRGLLHSGSHAIEFFNMLGCDNYDMFESKADSRVWELVVAWKNCVFREQRNNDEPVWDYYDKSHYYIIHNAYNFLEGIDEIKCNGEMALEALEKCYELMEEKYNEKISYNFYF